MNTVPEYCCIGPEWITRPAIHAIAAQIHAPTAMYRLNAHRPPTMLETRSIKGKNEKFGLTFRLLRSPSFRPVATDTIVAAAGAARLCSISHTPFKGFHDHDDGTDPIIG